MNKVLVILVLGLLLILSHVYLSNIIYPNTYIGDIKITGLSYKDIGKFLDTEAHKNIVLYIGERSYTYTYQDLGIYVDKKKAMRNISEHNRYPQKIFHYVSSLGKDTVINPPLFFTQDFYEYAKEARFEFPEEGTDEIKPYQIDAETLKTQILVTFGMNEPIEVALVPPASLAEADPTLLAKRVTYVLEDPVEVLVTDGKKNKEIQLAKQEVKGVSSVRMDPENANIHIAVNRDKLQAIVEEKTKIEQIDGHELHDNLWSLIETRLYGNITDMIQVQAATKPFTNGEKAQRYIEVHISDKKLYYFQDSALVYSYNILSGSCDGVVADEYQVIKKEDVIFSHEHDKWNRYWIGFSHDTETNTLMGISEVPYEIRYKEEKEQRKPKENKRKTKHNTCMSLPIGYAKNIYDASVENMPVYVF